MLTESQLFKAAFLARCADAGLGPSDAHRLVQSLLGRTKQADFFDAAGRVISKSLPLTVAVLGGLPLAAGAAGGHILAKMQGEHDEDPAEIRTQENIQQYRRLATELSIQKRLREQAAAKTRAAAPLVR